MPVALLNDPIFSVTTESEFKIFSFSIYFLCTQKMGSHKIFAAYICFTITNFLAIFVATKDPGPRLDLGPANKSLVLFVGSRTNNLPELCSGVIVAPHYVLTSDKCVEGLGRFSLKIHIEAKILNLLLFTKLSKNKESCFEKKNTKKAI